MPERKSAFFPRAGFAAWISDREEAMLMATSITAPRALITIPPVSSPVRPMGMPCCRSWSRGSTSLSRRPSIRLRLCTTMPKSMASPVPATVPSMAQTVFFLMPPRMVRLTTVT